MAKANPLRNAVVQISGGVHQDDFRKSFRNSRRGSHRDGPAPVVRDQRDVLQVEFFDELAQILGAAVERIRVLSNRRFFREPATDMVDGDRSIFPAKRLDHVAENKRPSRVPVRHKERRTLDAVRFGRAFVDVMILESVDFDVTRFKRVKRTPKRVVFSLDGESRHIRSQNGKT